MDIETYGEGGELLTRRLFASWPPRPREMWSGWMGAPLSLLGVDGGRW